MKFAKHMRKPYWKFFWRFTFIPSKSLQFTPYFIRIIILKSIQKFMCKLKPCKKKLGGNVSNHHLTRPLRVRANNLPVALRSIILCLLHLNKNFLRCFLADILPSPWNSSFDKRLAVSLGILTNAKLKTDSQTGIWAWAMNDKQSRLIDSSNG